MIHPALCGHSPCGLGRDLLAWLGLEEGGRTSCLAGQRASSTELGASENSVCWSWSSQITWPVTCHFTEVDPEQQTGPGHGDIPVVAPLGLSTMEPSLPGSLGSRSACSPVYHHPDGWASHGPGAGMAVMMTDREHYCKGDLFTPLQIGCHSLGGVRRGSWRWAGKGL